MKQMIAAVCAAIVVSFMAGGPALAYDDGSSEFIGSVFGDRYRVNQVRSTGRQRSKGRRAGRDSGGVAVGAGTRSGIASYYWQPQPLASGGRFNPNALTAAHKTLPFGTRVRVTNLGNGRSVVVRINDRGPYIRGRIIDLSRRAAGVVGMRGSGLARVRLDILGRG